MADDKKKNKKSGWISLSNSKLEADVAYFEARLSMLDEKPTTSHQHAQLIAYKALEGILSEALERLTEQQRKRRKMRAKIEVPLAEQLDNKDIKSIIEDGSDAVAEKTPASPETSTPEAVSSNLTPSSAVAPTTEDSASMPEPAAELEEESTVAEPADSASQSITPPEAIDLEKEIPVPEIETLTDADNEEELADVENFGSFGSENVYLRNALFSTNLSFLQEAEEDPEEVQEEWVDVEESEIIANVGNLDSPADIVSLEAGVADLGHEVAKHEANIHSFIEGKKTRFDESTKNTIEQQSESSVDLEEDSSDSPSGSENP